MRPPEIQATLSAPATTRLSEPVPVTLRITGPAPVQVTLPAELAPRGLWQVRVNGPPRTEPQPDGRETWRIELLADPLLPGELVPLTLATVGVRAGPGASVVAVTPEPATVEVTTNLTADLRHLRGATGPLPAPAPPETDSVLPIFAVLIGGVLVGFGLILVRRAQRRSRPAPETDFTQTAPDWPDVEFADRLAATVRTWANADRLTTAETLALFATHPHATDLTLILQTCDKVKFAGHTLTPATRQELLAATQRIKAA